MALFKSPSQQDARKKKEKYACMDPNKSDGGLSADSQESIFQNVQKLRNYEKINCNSQNSKCNFFLTIKLSDISET